MEHPHPIGDPIPDRAELKLQQFAASGAEPDQYGIAVVLRAVNEWGGYRYTNISDAIASTRRASK